MRHHSTVLRNEAVLSGAKRYVGMPCRAMQRARHGACGSGVLWKNELDRTRSYEQERTKKELSRAELRNQKNRALALKIVAVTIAENEPNQISSVQFLSR